MSGMGIIVASILVFVALAIAVVVVGFERSTSDNGEQ
jgi:hypothetical protein